MPGHGERAFAQVDREVRRYLMATPVPEIATPWRAEPLLAAPTRPRTSPGHWRITTVGLALVFVLLLVGTALTFFTMRDTGRDVALTTGGSTAIAAQAALPTPLARVLGRFRRARFRCGLGRRICRASARAASGAASGARHRARRQRLPPPTPSAPSPRPVHRFDRARRVIGPPRWHSGLRFGGGVGCHPDRPPAVATRPPLAAVSTPDAQATGRSAMVRRSTRCRGTD